MHFLGRGTSCWVGYQGVYLAHVGTGHRSVRGKYCFCVSVCPHGRWSSAHYVPKRTGVDGLEIVFLARPSCVTSNCLCLVHLTVTNGPSAESLGRWDRPFTCIAFFVDDVVLRCSSSWTALTRWSNGWMGVRETDSLNLRAPSAPGKTPTRSSCS